MAILSHKKSPSGNVPKRSFYGHLQPVLFENLYASRHDPAQLPFGYRLPEFPLYHVGKDVIRYSVYQPFFDDVSVTVSVGLTD